MLLHDCRYLIYILLSPRQKHNILSHEKQYQTILIQTLIFLPACRYNNVYPFSPYNTIHYYLHAKTIPYYPLARLYPIFPIQIFTLLPHADVQTLALLNSWQTYTLWSPGNTRPYYLVSNLHSNLKAARRFWSLYPIIPMHHNTPLYWFKSSLHLQISK